MLRYDGRVALITGSTAGVGKAYAELLGSRGAKVIINCRKENDAAHAVVDHIKANGGEAHS
ncbi:MAG: SDR family NAD(P)-dependent oxidoreductase [Lachnospiraceae bacterium]|nr:SDR family NAD(P)-dependent oxidoreductase [Lachnospiraceae bacterium]